MQSFIIIFAFVRIFLVFQCKAQSPDISRSPARSLDSLLQDYAYRAFNRPRTGVPYDGEVPSNITGIKIAALRLKIGSLRNRGFRSYKEFQIPTGITVQPYAERVAFVYQNLGNWTSIYYPLPGYTYLAPVVGLLAYNAANLSGTGLPELDIVTSKSPISINFMDASPVPSGSVAKCVWFDLNGTPEFRDSVSSNVCSTYREGHFSIVVNSTGLSPAPAPRGAPSSIPRPRRGHKTEVWKIVGVVVGGFVVLFLLALFFACIHQYRHNKSVTEMERHADVGESLRKAWVGNAQAPAASGTRTQPFIENDYVP